MCDGKDHGKTIPSWISCREVVRQLLDYSDGTLDDGARRTLDRHLKMCPSCREFLAQYQCLPGLVGEALTGADEDHGRIPADAAERLKLFLATEMKKSAGIHADKLNDDLDESGDV